MTLFHLFDLQWNMRSWKSNRCWAIDGLWLSGGENAHRAAARTAWLWQTAMASAGSDYQNALIIVMVFYQTIMFNKFCHSLFLIVWLLCWLFLRTTVMPQRAELIMGFFFRQQPFNFCRKMPFCALLNRKPKFRESPCNHDTGHLGVLSCSFREK